MKGSLGKIKPQVLELAPYTLRRYEHKIKVNQNENPFDVPREIKDYVLALARERSWSRYPDLAAGELKSKLSEYAGWPEEGILVGNGSNELIQAIMIATLGPGKRLTIPVPTFTLYGMMARALGAEVIEVPLRTDYSFDVDAILEAVEDPGADLLVISSPNNPTGCLMDPADVERVVSSTEALVVLDEAYYEFSQVTCVPLMRRHDNLVILRTFSKAFSMAGLRVGYFLGAPELAAQISKCQLPYNLNFFSQAAAVKLLENRDALFDRIDYIRRQRDILYERMGNMEGLKPYRSWANFILFETDMLPAKEVFERLLSRGILVRDVSSYPMLSKALRVSVGTEEENGRFIEAMEDILGEALRG